MFKFIIPSALMLLTCLSLKAQVHGDSLNHSKFEHRLHIGYNVGGLAPVSFPNTIRKIKSYSPGFAPSVGYEISYAVKKRWRISTGLRLDWKSMNVTDEVQYFHTLVSMGNSSIEGDFTGTNNTIVKNIYLTLPITAVYTNGHNWRFKFGGYVARLVKPSFYGSVSNGYLRKGNSLGEKVIIDNATFDFKDKQRKFDFGLSGGADRAISKRFAIAADLQWGLRPVYPKSFTGISFNMYNIFATIALNYKLPL